ncbi:hypothetical protein CSPAE12_04667 [Colletotrichum incanum]|nr:hypothetical protein CSPAE12_04667 [Colletotrichum incanum]
MASLSRHLKALFCSYRTSRVCRVQGEKSYPHGGAVAVARLTAIEAVSTIPSLSLPRLLSVPCTLSTSHRTLVPLPAPLPPSWLPCLRPLSAAPLFCFLPSHGHAPPLGVPICILPLVRLGPLPPRQQCAFRCSSSAHPALPFPGPLASLLR